MLKTVGLMPKRPDFTLAAFRTYYETRHSELALSLPEHFRFAKYVRNHIVAASEELYFHTISEFWFKSADDVARARQFLQSPAGEVVLHDERQFLNQDRQASFGSTEFLLAGPPRGIEAPLAPRVFFPFVLAEKNPDRDDLVDELSRRISAAGLANTRWALDLVGPPVYRDVPIDGMLSVWVDPAHPAPRDVTDLLAGIGTVRWRIETEATETPRERLPNAA